MQNRWIGVTVLVWLMVGQSPTAAETPAETPAEKTAISAVAPEVAREVAEDVAAREVKVRVERLIDAPIITPEMDPSIGVNIQGPSLIRVPDWVANPLGRYYLYFADHKGQYIRLAYAQALTGPWTIHVPGSLQLHQSHFPTQPPAVDAARAEQIRARTAESLGGMDRLPHDLIKELTAPHIASPDVHVDHEKRQIIMYYHGLADVGVQLTRVAVSTNGVDFTAGEEILGKTYWRAFAHDGMTYALAMPGQLYRSSNPLGGFEAGPLLFNSNMRHAGLLRRGSQLWVFWTQVADAPERILLSRIDLSGDWLTWKDSPPVEVLRPQRPWEGADSPLQPSMRSVAYGHVNQLRDPAVYIEGDAVYLLYAVAGESGIAIARLHLD